VTGLVLAVFLGTMVGAIVPAVNATEASPANAALSNVLVDLVGLDSHAGAKLLSGLHGIAGATAYPLYSPLTAATAWLAGRRATWCAIRPGSGAAFLGRDKELLRPV
jgi:hypothetical protein